MKTSYCYWAGPWEPSGPRPHSACSDRAKGSAAAWQGLRPTATWPSSAEAKGTRPAGAPGDTAARHARVRAPPGHRKARGHAQDAQGQGGHGAQGRREIGR